MPTSSVSGLIYSNTKEDEKDIFIRRLHYSRLNPENYNDYMNMIDTKLIG